MGFEWNKIAAAFLACAFVVLGVNFLSDGIYHADVPEQQGYVIEGAEVEVAATSAEEETIESVSTMLASMEISEGEKVARKCIACHTFDKGGANKVGPALYGIVNREIAAVDGFSYSAALKAHAEDGKIWTYDELNGFLYRPKDHVPGTFMGFAGLRKTGDRAAMIAYLRSLADTMAPLPDPAEAESTENGEGAADTPTKDATIVTPAPARGSETTSGGATGTELTPKVESDTAEPATEEGTSGSQADGATESGTTEGEVAPGSDASEPAAETE